MSPIIGFLYVPRPINCNNLFQVGNVTKWKFSENRLYECCSPYFNTSDMRYC